MSRYEIIHTTDFGGRNLFGVQGDKVSYAIECPYCGSFGTFPNVFSHKVTFENLMIEEIEVLGKSRRFDANTSVSAHMCPNPECQGIVLVASYDSTRVSHSPSSDFDIHMEHVPTEIYSTFKESIKCYNAGAFRAAALMVRRVLEEVCEDSGASGNTLHQRLKALREQVILPTEFFEVLDELKALGNDAAHVSAKNYLVIGEEEARISIELAAELLKARFEIKSLVHRIRSRKLDSE